MSIFLNWKNTISGSIDRFLMSLFSHLSPRWYPVNIIKSSIYDILKMYAGELKNLQTEIDTTYRDLSIEQCRIEVLEGRSTTKLYDNFGTMLGVNRLYYQDYSTFRSSYGLMPYRQELKQLSQAFLGGTSTEALSRVGYGFTGVSPIVGELAKIYNGWTLTAPTGSILGIHDGFIELDRSIPRLGKIIPCYDTSLFEVGDIIVISYSKLGTNTIIRSKSHAFSTLDVEFFAYASMSVNTSFSSAVETTIDKVIKADQDIRISYNSNYVYYRPVNDDNIDQLASGAVAIDNYLSLSPEGYLYNHARIPGEGVSFETDVLVLPSGSNYLDWYFDFFTVSRNEANITLEVRQYATSSIPDTVYYSEINSEHVSLLPTPSVDLGGAHYIPSTQGKFIDISGHNLPLPLIAGSGSYFVGRHPARPALQFASGDSSYGIPGGSSDTLTLYDTFYCSMWVYGVDQQESGSVFLRRHSNVGSGSYDIGINAYSGIMYLDINNPATGSLVTTSIADILQEQPYRPHLFEFSYYRGYVQMFVDGTLRSSQMQEITSLPSLNTDAELILYASGSVHLGIDEIVIGEDTLTENESYTGFIDTKPRYYFLGIPSGSTTDNCYQGKLTFYATGANEIEFHQFTLKGSNHRGLSLLVPSYKDIFYVPIEKY